MYNREEVVAASLKYFRGDDLAANVFTDKYSLKDKQNNYYELTPDDMHRRLAKDFARIEKNYPNPLSEEEIYNLLKGFKYIVPQGSPMAGIGNPYQITSLSNCFVIGNEFDSYGAIMRTDEEQVQIMKRRGGVGHDISHLRPTGAQANNSILSGLAGATLYMNRYSNSTREVSQGDRRGALMLSISIKHPDTEKFIDIKLDTKKITGANISVRIANEFMEDVINDRDYIQTFPVDLDIKLHTGFCESLHNGEIEYDKLYDLQYDNNEEFKGCYAKRIKAKKLWKKIVSNNWRSAEPGVLFWDTILHNSPANGYGKEWKETSTNPCFTGDTIVAVADGRNGVSIKELADKDEDFLVYSARLNNKNAWKSEIKKAKAFKTGIRKIILVELSDGSSFKCTPDHRLALSDGSYIEAEDSIGSRLEELKSKGVNVDFSEGVFVEDIVELGVEEVYDLTVEDNHNFYIITKTDDEKYLNCSGVLVHNCGEIPIPPLDACRLLLLNLYSYVDDPFTKGAEFNFQLFRQHVRIAQRLMDDLVDLEIEKIDQIISKIESDSESPDIKSVELNLWKKIRNKAIEGRRTGLGITAEGDMIAALNMTYGSDVSIQFAQDVHKVMAIESYKSSIEMAKERGSFKIWNRENEVNNPFIQRIMLERGSYSFDPSYLSEYINTGRRNIANLTIAPAGSVSILTQTTSGIEPCFLPYYKRRRKTNDEAKCTFKDEVGDMWEEYNVFHHKFVEWYRVKNNISENTSFQTTLDELTQYSEEWLEELFVKSPYYKATSNDIDWNAKVKLQGAVQKWVDHSISCTTNIPKTASKSVVNDIYITAWKEGCKGVTVYRDGSRSGVLVSKDNNTQNDDFDYISSFKRPEVVGCHIHHISVKGEKITVLIGVINNKPFELFAFDTVENIIFPKGIKNGKIKKVSRGTYHLIAKTGDKEYILNLNKLLSNDEKRSTREFSTKLRHRISPQYIVEQEEKVSGDMGSFRKAIVRILKLYIKDGTKVSGDECPECGSDLVFESGCVSCKSCGWSKCF